MVGPEKPGQPCLGQFGPIILAAESGWLCPPICGVAEEDPLPAVAPPGHMMRKTGSYDSSDSRPDHGLRSIKRDIK